MALELTIHPESSLSPHQRTMAKAPEIANDDFMGSFADLLDVVNPLQHLPGISSIYQAFTGDSLSTGAKIAGGALFGGGIGFIASIANAIVEQETGKDIAGSLFAAVTGKYEDTAKLAS